MPFLLQAPTRSVATPFTAPWNRFGKLPKSRSAAWPEGTVHLSCRAASTLPAGRRSTRRRWSSRWDRACRSSSTPTCRHWPRCSIRWRPPCRRGPRSRCCKLRCAGRATPPHRGSGAARSPESSPAEVVARTLHLASAESHVEAERLRHLRSLTDNRQNHALTCTKRFTKLLIPSQSLPLFSVLVRAD